MSDPGQFDKPVFSIITVTLNPGRDLEDTMKSVLDQTFGHFEVIVKDGGSKDGTEKRMWPDPRVARHSSRDSGIYDAMNQALVHAHGDYIHFLNAGDRFFRKDALERVAEAIQLHPEAEFFYGHVHKPTSRSGYEIYPKRLSRYYLYAHTICHQAWFVKRTTYARYGGFETAQSTDADYRLLLNMLVRDSIPYRIVPEVLVSYKGGGFSSKNQGSEQLRRSTDALKKELFSPAEGLAYSAIWKTRNLVKRLIYDTLLWRVWRFLRSCTIGTEKR